jgi:Kef-type K+ transport system membrane component KefB/nucleotide-binding universal stress UspA family protein
METDLSVVGRARRTALSVSLAGIAVPFALGFALGMALPDDLLPDPGKRLITALFLAVALSISSVKIVTMVVRELGFLRRTVGQVIVASAIIDDTIGWIIMAVTFGLALHGSVDVASLAQSVIGTAAFLVISFTLGRRVVFRLILWANDSFVSEMPVITMILAIMGAMALITSAIGVHTVLGAFVAGILIGQSPNLTGHIDEQLRGLIVSLFMPVFFGMAGLATNLLTLANTELLALTVFLIAIASVGKFGGAFMGGRFGGLSWGQSLAIGCGMNARGSTEVIVATLGLSMGALSENLFSSIVAMAVVTTLSMPPMLRWALGRLPPSAEERARLERETLEATSFVAAIERLLVTVDASPSGQFAARLVGLLAGVRRITTTVLHFDYAPDTVAPDGTRQADRTRALVIEGVESVDRGALSDGDAAPPLIVTRAETPTEEAITAEAKKGFDLLIVGREPASEGETLHDRIARSAAAFGGPFALAIARGRHRKANMGTRLRILVPVDGTAAARTGAELAIALAQGSRGAVTALHVASKPPSARRRGAGPRRAEDTGGAEAILRDAGRLGAPYGVTVREKLTVADAVAEAIVAELRSGDHDLVVLGVNPRPGDRLSFGALAATLLDRAPCSVVFVAPTAFAPAAVDAPIEPGARSRGQTAA